MVIEEWKEKRAYWGDSDEFEIEPTPHEAYEQHCTPEVAQTMWNAVKSQAMKDYIGAVARLRDNPKNPFALDTKAECEEFFTELGKIDTVQYKLKYDGGMFECIAMEHFPEEWGVMLPSGKHSVKCPICKDGHVGRFYRPADRDAPINPRNKHKYDPRITFSCDVCTFRKVFHLGRTDDDYLKEQAKQWKHIAIQQRNQLCRQETQEQLNKHPEWNQREKDLCYQRMAKKWHV